MERRFTDIAPTHIRSAAFVRTIGSNAVISGYAAVWYNATLDGCEYELGPGLVERVTPGAFSRSIRSDDVRALLNHDPSALLGRTKSGTLTLSEDGRGLRYRITLPSTQLGKDVGVLVGRGDLTGASFGFEVIKAEHGRDGRLDVRWLRQVRLFDVSIVSFPAYTGTSAEIARSRITNTHGSIT